MVKFISFGWWERRALFVAAAVIALVLAGLWFGTRSSTPAGSVLSFVAVADDGALADLVAEAERLGRVVAAGPVDHDRSGPGALSREEALWALCWQATDGLNRVLSSTRHDGKAVLLGQLYPRLFETCLAGVAGRVPSAGDPSP